MLETLDEVPWSQLEHAYGAADDVPDLIRALVSSDAESRHHAQHMLYMGPFHQGTVTSCLSYVVRFLVELLGYETTPDRNWILTYLANAAAACDSCVEVDLDAIPRVLRADFIATSDEGNLVVESLCGELEKGLTLYLQLLKMGSVDERAAVPALLAQLKCRDEKIHQHIGRQLRLETDIKVRAILSYCLGIVLDRQNLPYTDMLHDLVRSSKEYVTVRLAAGIGLLNMYRNSLPLDILKSLAELMVQHPEQVNTLEMWHQVEITGLVKTLPYTNLLDVLILLGREQRLLFVPSIKRLQEHALENSGRKSGYYTGLLKKLVSDKP